MSLVSDSWDNNKDDSKTVLILYSCLSASTPGGKSIGQKISNYHKNITVVAFDGYVNYGRFSGKIESVSQEYGKRDGLGKIVIYKSGVEIQRSSFYNPWEIYFYNMRILD